MARAEHMLCQSQIATSAFLLGKTWRTLAQTRHARLVNAEHASDAKVTALT